MSNIRKLNEKQKRFVDEYLVDLNATQAAIRAGYSANRASEISWQLLQKTTVQAYLADRQKSLSERTEITQEMVVQELAKIAFADIRKAVKWSPSMGEMLVPGDDDELVPVQTNGVMLVPSDEVDDSTAGAIAEIAQTRDGIKIKFHDKQAALVSIGRHIGMFNDKLTLQGDKDKPLEVRTRIVKIPTKIPAVVETKALKPAVD